MKSEAKVRVRERRERQRDRQTDRQRRRRRRRQTDRQRERETQAATAPLSDETVDYDDICADGGLEDRASVATMEVDVDLFQNPKTKSLHARAMGSLQDGKSPCGHSVQGFLLLKGRVYSQHWKCRQCVRAKPLRGRRITRHPLPWLASCNIGALIIRIGFRGPIYYNCSNKEPPK